MVGEAPAGQPVAPVVLGVLKPLLGVLEVARAVDAGRPSERDVAPLALDERVAGAAEAALDAEPQVRVQRDPLTA